MTTFRQRLQEAVHGKNTHVCLGIDPHTDKFPPFLLSLCQSLDPVTAISRWVQPLLEIAAPYIPAVKFQSAFFEAQGWQGVRCLQELCASAGRLGLVTIFDGKRGDISSTMTAYGVAAFEQLKVDCMTVQGYVGLEVLTALKPWLVRDKGVYLLWLTSNPGHATVQLHPSPQGTSLAADILPPLRELLVREGMSESCGLVLGATRLETIDPALMSRAQEFPLLLPGLGEQQGGDGPTLRNLLRRDSGHLVPISRGLTGIGSSQWQETIANMSLNKYFTWFEAHLQEMIRSLGTCET